MLLLYTGVMQAQDKLVKDLDFDGIKDSIFLDNPKAPLVIKLSTQNFQLRVNSICADEGMKKNIEETKNGFKLSWNYMRSGYTMQYRYSQEHKKIRLIGMTYYNFGPASHDGSGQSSANLLTDEYIANWQYVDIKAPHIITLPTMNVRLNFPLSFLGNEQKSYDLFLAENTASLKRGVRRYLVKTYGINQLKDEVWEGKLGNNIPVCLRYHKFYGIPYGRYGDLVIGSITYLNIKAKIPIPLLGYEDKEGDFYLSEFQEDGKISGVIRGDKKENNFKAEWIKPYNPTSYKLKLTQKDSLIATPIIETISANYAGEYYYQFGEKGPLGEWKVRVLGNDKLEVQAFSVTSAPARNMAEIKKDTVKLQGNSFAYSVKSGPDCAIDIQAFFFKNFMLVYYTNENPCPYYFGHNATLEGVFYKIK